MDATVYLEKDLTILVGENNGGKTSVLDALRLLTSPSDGRRVRYPETNDVYRDTPDASLQLDAHLESLSESQKGWFITALTDPTETSAVLGYEWSPPTPGHRRERPTLTVGPRRSLDPEPAVRDLIRHVYLPALRDATRDLASSSPGRIEFLLRHLLGADTAESKEKEKVLLERARTAFNGLMEDPTLRAASGRVAEEFDPLTYGFHPHSARLEFADATLIGLARDLRFRLSQRGVQLADLSETGLGYANLLYLASVLVELAAAKDAELTLLLVEEPEAHLHPQLQAVTLELLLKRAQDSRKRDVPRGHRAGHIQVIVTTHSPNLASSVPCRHIVALRSTPSAPTSPEVPQTAPDSGASADAAGAESGRSEGIVAGPSPMSPVTQAVAVSRLDIEPALLRKVDRYLDVTRSAMLFSRRVLLVEGLGEALLVPVFARQLFAGDQSALNRFYSSTVVAIDGVDFEPFVRLLLCPEATGGASIAEHVVVVTDDDVLVSDPEEAAEVEGEDSEQSETEESEKPGSVKNSPGHMRKESLRAMVQQFGVEDRLTVEITNVTLEHALIEHCADDEAKLGIVESAYAKLRVTPAAVERRRERFRRVVTCMGTPADRACAFRTVLMSANFRKGDFAQLLAAEIEPAEGSRIFGVPEPFEEALRRLVEVRNGT